MISKEFLMREYVENKQSSFEIGKLFGCSTNQVNYWLLKYKISKRNISEAVYVKSNPKGDPFKIKKPTTSEEWFLYGLGIGLFWGEGNKVNKSSVRLGNTDADLIKNFLLFLKLIYGIDEQKLRFGLQIFSDIQPRKALKYWTSQLGVSEDQFQKVIVTPSIRPGSYKKKSEFGVLTVYFSNTKLRDTIISAIEKLRNSKPL